MPHVQPPGSTFFITFRLADSLPQVLFQQWNQEKRRPAAEQEPIPDEQKRRPYEREWKRRWFHRFEELLDQAESGPEWLKDERVASQMVESLHYRDGKVYDLDAYCIMPNHVHTVFTPLMRQTDSLPYSMARILHSLKGYTARQANRLLARNGAFWEHESFDHYIRSQREWERIVAYVLDNPVKAGLVQEWQEWPWSYYRYAARGSV